MQRIGIAIVAAGLLAGCANDRPMGAIGFQSAMLTSPVHAAGKDAAAGLEQEIEARNAARKSMAARVLAAIALERVTGLKPDPARLAAMQ